MTPREIKAALVERGVRQADIARATKYSGAYVNDVIAGKRRCAPIEQAIAEAIGKPVGDVFPVAQPASALAS